MKLLTDGNQYHIGIDSGSGRDVSVIQRRYEDGTYTVETNGVVSERRPIHDFHGREPFLKVNFGPFGSNWNHSIESKSKLKD